MQCTQLLTNIICQIHARGLYCRIYFTALWSAGKGMPVRRSDGEVTETLVKLGANCRYMVTAYLKRNSWSTSIQISEYGKRTDAENVSKHSWIYCRHRVSDIKSLYCPFKLMTADVISPRGLLCCRHTRILSAFYVSIQRIYQWSDDNNELLVCSSRLISHLPLFNNMTINFQSKYQSVPFSTAAVFVRVHSYVRYINIDTFIQDD
jgi:hypothetical protein